MRDWKQLSSDRKLRGKISITWSPEVRRAKNPERSGETIQKKLCQPQQSQYSVIDPEKDRDPARNQVSDALEERTGSQKARNKQL